MPCNSRAPGSTASTEAFSILLYTTGLVHCETCYCLPTFVFFPPPEFPDCNLGKRNMVKTVTNTVFIPSSNSLVIFVARQRAGQRRSWCHQRPCGLASSYAADRGALSAGLKWRRRESGYSQSNAEIKNEWSCTFTHPYATAAWTKTILLFKLVRAYHCHANKIPTSPHNMLIVYSEEFRL